jgi:hypothetical protein
MLDRPIAVTGERPEWLRVVRHLPVRAELSKSGEAWGRCWTSLQGGNRGDVLMRSAGARHYGDLMVGRNQCDGDRRDGVIGVCRWRAKHALAACV